MSLLNRININPSTVNYRMGETKRTQKKSKASVDEKLALGAPSRDLLETLAVQCAREPSHANTFQYAFALSQSRNKAELRYSISILDGLVKEGYTHQVDCMYGAATALYLLGEYDDARVSTFAFLFLSRVWILRLFLSSSRVKLEIGILLHHSLTFIHSFIHSFSHLLYFLWNIGIS